MGLHLLLQAASIIFFFWLLNPLRLGTLTQSWQLPDKAILICIRGDLVSVFPRPDLFGSLTSFGEEKEGEHIYHLYPNTCLNLAFLHCHAHLRMGVLLPLVPLHHSHYPQIAGV